MCVSCHGDGSLLTGRVLLDRYASLYFIACISKDENELITLEAIHLFVEVLDRYFGNVRLTAR